MADLNAMRKERRTLKSTIASLTEQTKQADAAYRKLRKATTDATVALSKLNREIAKQSKLEDEL